ncbi:MAG: transglycosylase domain-containing protein [Deltaproteobacteria bacterium]|nr:transglycosylase domain-containing protein [Deltaproteobacteria bacterium]
MTRSNPTHAPAIDPRSPSILRSRPPWARAAARRILALSFLLPSLLLLGLLAEALPKARLTAPEPTLLLRDRDERFLAELSARPEDELGYWPLEALPPRVVAATAALEDRRFEQHPGVDLLGVGRALLQNAREGEVVSGASTLAMQVARMQDPGPRTLHRKAVEALTALLLTERYGRAAVLAHYLRLAPYGNRIHGIRYAARRYLDKPVADLSWAEIAFLAAMPQAPSRTNPFHEAGRRRAVRRGGRILAALRAQGLLNADELTDALAELARLRMPHREERPPWAMHPILRYEAALRAPGAREGLPLTLHSTLDLDVQLLAERHAREVVEAYRWRGAENAAVMVARRDTREVLAAVGSIDYFASDGAGAIDYTRTPRYPGSTLKPFLYALALERGVITPATVLDDLKRGPDGITNYDSSYLGPLLPRVALANSRNVPAAGLLHQLGIYEVYDLYRDLGLHRDALPADHYGTGLAVGGMPLTLEALVQGYTALTGDGRVEPLRWLAEGPSPAGDRIFQPDTAAQLTHFLSDPMARLPSFPRMGSGELPFPVAFKTGTSADYRDAWIVSWTGELVVAAWVGNPGWKPMRKLPGGLVAAEIARTILLDLNPARSDGLSDLSFPPPAGWVPARLCADTGALDQGYCDRVVTEWFRQGQAPTEPDTAHLRLAVDRRDGLLASASTPPAWTEVRSFVDLGPHYAEWQALAGIPRPPSALSAGGAGQQAPPSPQLQADAPTLRLTSPVSGLRVRRDPDIPPELSTVALRVEVSERVPQVVWEVDGEPWRVAGPPYTARWPIQPGLHRFQARLPWSEIRSNTVSILGE